MNEDLLALLHVVLDELHCCLHVLHSRLDVVHRGKIQLLDALRGSEMCSTPYNHPSAQVRRERKGKGRALRSPCRTQRGRRPRRTDSQLRPPHNHIAHSPTWGRKCVSGSGSVPARTRRSGRRCWFQKVGRQPRYTSSSILLQYGDGRNPSANVPILLG